MMDPFEQSADMRLLELQRKALGKEAPPRSSWTATQADMHDAIPPQEEFAPVLSGPRMNVDLSATPSAKLIPGAVVTLSLAIHNVSETPIERITAAVPIPGESSYRPGSLVLDRRPVSETDADAFFGQGYLIAKLSPGQRVGLTWKISIEPGAKALVVSPRVRADGAGVSGGAQILLSRGAPHISAKLPKAYAPPAEEPERPFYELDEAEEQAMAGSAPSSEGPRPAAPLFVMPDILELPSAPPVELTGSAAEPVVEDPVIEEPVAAQPAITEAVATAPRIYCTFDAASLGVVKKLFSSESFGQVPHYILQNSLACSLAASGRDFGLRTHLSQQAGLLSRALLMRKLNKTMNVSDFATGKTDLDLKPADEPGSGKAPSLLYMDLTQADIDFCAPVESRNQLETFIRIRQLAVALQAHHVVTDDKELAARAEALLEGYATAARAAINRTFIRAKLDRNFDPFGAVDPAADALAHELIDVLATLVGA